ncbi:hypothetical protein GGH92_003951 [Coemansia sp. RSA 2673]|nr:hypothetical protein GGH92_003951 [Coemansia sp. RSA 2673]
MSTATGTTVHGDHFIPGRVSWPDLMRMNVKLVDKSLAIERVLESGYYIMVALAPPGSGKSTFLSMLAEYLALYSKVPRETRLGYFGKYDLYTKRRGFFDEHFAKYPVIHLDFSVSTLCL